MVTTYIVVAIVIAMFISSVPYTHSAHIAKIRHMIKLYKTNIIK